MQPISIPTFPGKFNSPTGPKDRQHLNDDVEWITTITSIGI